MYDPKVGRWLSEDPLGFDAGDANLYRYVQNDPVNHVDPSGLESIPPSVSLIPAPGDYPNYAEWDKAMEDFFQKHKAQMTQRERLRFLVEIHRAGQEYWEKIEATEKAKNRKASAAALYAARQKWGKECMAFANELGEGWRHRWKWRNFKPDPKDYMMIGPFETNRIEELYIFVKINKNAAGPKAYAASQNMPGHFDSDGILQPFLDHQRLNQPPSGHIDLIDSGSDVLGPGKAGIKYGGKAALRELAKNLLPDQWDVLKWLMKSRIPSDLQIQEDDIGAEYMKF